MNKTSLYISLSCIVMVGIVLIYYSYPSSKTFALMYLQDKRYVEAYEVFNKMYQQGDRSVDVMVNIVNLDMYLGNTKDAVNKMEELLELYPDYTLGKEKLGVLYKYDNRMDAYLTNLESIVEERPTIENLEELILLYQQYSIKNKLVPAYEKLLELGVRDEKNIAIFATVLAEEKQYKRAIEVLSLIPINRFENSENVELFVGLLLDAGEVTKAKEVTLQYLELHPQIELVISFADAFYRHGEVQEAFNIVGNYKEQLVNDSDLLMAYVAYGMELGKKEEIYRLLVSYQEKGVLPQSAMDSFILLAIDQQDYVLLDKMLHEIDVSSLSDQTLVSLINYLNLQDNQKGIEWVTKKIGEERILKSPLLQISILLAGNPTLEKFEQLFSSKEFTVTEKFSILEFLMSQADLEHGKIVFDSISSLDGLSKGEILKWAKYALLLDKVPQAKQVALQYIGQYPDIEPRKLVGPIDIYFDAASEDPKLVIQSLKRMDPFDQDLVQELFNIAYDKKNKAMALALASYWYEEGLNFKSKRAYGSALVMNGQFAKGLEVLKQIIENYALDPSMIQPYLLALSQTDQTAELDQFLQKVIVDKQIPLSYKSDWAQAFLDINDKIVAEAIYLYLVNKSFDKEYLESLIDIWGECPPDYAFSYIKRWAPRFDLDAKVVLSQYLIELKRPGLVLHYFDCKDLERFELGKLYMEAALLVRDGCLFHQILNFMKGQDLSIKEWITLADLAYDHDKFIESNQIYRWVYCNDSSQTASLKKLVLGTFYLGEFREAHELLLHYIMKAPNDPLGYYYVGILLEGCNYKEEARRFFRKVVHSVDEEYGSQEERLAMFDSLYSLGWRNVSLSKFKEIYCEDPLNLTLIYEFAVHLESAKYYCASLCVLNSVLSSFENDLYHRELTDWDTLFSLYLEKVRVLVHLWRTDDAYCLLKEIEPYLCYFNQEENYWKTVSEYENKLGAWIAGLQAILIGKQIAPWNEGLDLASWALWEEHRSYVEPSYMLRVTNGAVNGTPNFANAGNSNYTEHLSTFKFLYRHEVNLSIYNQFDVDNVSAVAYQVAQTGLAKPFKGYRFKNETDLIYEWNGGNRGLLGFFIGSQIFGAQAGYQVKDLRGETSGLLVYHQPTWDVIETIVQRGTIDTIQLGRIHNFNQYLRIEGISAFRFWSVDHISAVDTTLRMNWNLIFSMSFAQIQNYLGETGFLDLIYNYDAEYVLDRKTITTFEGTVIPILDILTQENHTLKAVINWDFSRRFHTNDLIELGGFFGYNYNRFGRGNLTYGANFLYKKRWGWSIFANYSLYPDTFTGGQQTEYQIGAHYPF